MSANPAWVIKNVYLFKKKLTNILWSKSAKFKKSKTEKGILIIMYVYPC